MLRNYEAGRLSAHCRSFLARRRRWPEPTAKAAVAQALDCDDNSVLVGGRFRGIYALQNGATPKLLVNDITATTLLAIRGVEWSAGSFKRGTVAFGMREGMSVARPTRLMS